MVSFRILGPIEVRCADAPVTIKGLHHPRLLAMLLDEANRVVPTERLVAGLWDDRPPATAARQVQNIAAALRRQLGPAGDRLRKVDAGYRIDVETDELDLLRCRRSVAAAQDHSAAGRLVEAERALDDALAEWRGPAFAGLSGRTIELSAQRLEDYRLKLTEDHVDLGLRLGRHPLLAGDLQRLHAEHPYRQRFAEQLMLALYRCGRAPEALRVYAELRSRLAEELGTDPGKALRDLHTAILRDDPALDLGAPQQRLDVAPMNLPASTTVFTGRQDLLAALDTAVETPSSPLVVLSGVGGIGKTMLALHWGHRVAHRFPGGRLYIDLRGFAPNATPMDPAEAARLLLGAMGVDSRRIPADADAQIALFRSIVGSEQRLLILDNARDAAQVRPLLPTTAEVQTVVISRRQLAGLVASHGARFIEVDSLSRAEAAALLDRQLGSSRLAAEPEAVERILTACAGLPLALAIIAARAATHPGASLAAIAEELETSRLDALAGDEAPVDLRAVFSWSYSSLDADASRLFRLLGLIRGPDFGMDSAVRLHGGSADEAGRALRHLIEANLVEDGPSGRLRLHDLMRHHAAELVHTEEAKEDREVAATRLLDWYVDCAAIGRALLFPEVAALPLPTGRPDHRSAWSPAEAARWLQAEWTNLVAAIEYAADDELPQYAWRLADVLRGYAWVGMLGSDGLRIARAARAAADDAGDPRALASAELGMTSALIRSNRVHEAMEHARTAAELAREGDWIAGVAAAEFNLTTGAFFQGWAREGLAHGQAALSANRAIGDRHAECTNLHWLGILHSLVGEIETGIACFEEALTIATDTGAGSVKAVALTHMADVELFRGRLDLAAVRLDEAAELKRDSLGLDKSADVLGATARLRLAAGRTEEALDLAKQVVEGRTDAADHRFRTHALVTLAAAYDAAGDHGAAIAHYDLALARTEHDPTMFHRVEAMVGRSRALYRSGDVDRAKDEAARALLTARKADYRFLEGQALNQLAEIDLDEGRLGHAMDGVLRALSVCRETGHRPGEAVSLQLIARIALAEGDAETFKERSDEARALYADIGAPIPASLT